MADRYTKTVLTVIAACLVWIVARDVEVVKPAQAYGEATKVEVTNWPHSIRHSRVDVNIEQINGKGLNDFPDPLPVKVKNWP